MINASSFYYLDNSRNTENGYIFQASFNNHKYIDKTGDGLMIDYKMLIRLREFHEKVWLQSHINYYAIYAHIGDKKISMLLNYEYKDISVGSWNNFILYRLFSPAYQDRSLLLCEVDTMLWKFFRATRLIIRKIERSKRYD